MYELLAPSLLLRAASCSKGLRIGVNGATCYLLQKGRSAAPLSGPGGVVGAVTTLSHPTLQNAGPGLHYPTGSIYRRAYLISPRGSHNSGPRNCSTMGSKEIVRVSNGSRSTDSKGMLVLWLGRQGKPRVIWRDRWRRSLLRGFSC